MKYTSKEFKKMGMLLQAAKNLAIEYRQISGKPLGITAEVAEYEAAKRLRCTLMPARSPGFDLLDCDGKKIQVKGRAVFTKNTQKVGTILKSSATKPWDLIVLVLLDENYEAQEIYQLEAGKFPPPLVFSS